MNVVYSKIYEKQMRSEGSPSLRSPFSCIVMFFRYMIFIRREYLSVLFLLCVCSQVPAQIVGVKTNLLYDAAAIPSLGVETALSPHYTLNVSCTYCPLSYSGDRKWKNWSVLPEVRRWLCTPFCGPFVGVSAGFGGFNIQKIPILGLTYRRAQGTFYGGGLTLGWHQILSPHWGLESSVGVGLYHISYSRYQAGRCGYKDRESSLNAILPFGTGISLVYMLR